MNTDTNMEVHLVWDASRAEHAESPELLTVVATVDDAIAYGKRTFESSDYGDCNIERWVMGKETPEAGFTLAEVA